jgi:CRISPR-associated protein Cmx8
MGNQLMAKPTMKTEPIEAATVTIAYDLFDLPTAQHKAGLAGLLLQIDHMRGRKPQPPTPRVVERSATAATIEFAAETVQALMDNLYDAENVQVKVKSKWQGAAPLAEDFIEETDEKGSVKRVKVFVYEVCQPKGHFLRQYLPTMDPAKDWHRLWREMLWTIPRGNPQSRQPFEKRAATPKLPCNEGLSVWSDLQKAKKARAQNRFHTAPVSGSLLLGAQATNAESVPFEGRVEYNLLLHFWPLTSLVFVPQVVQPDGDSEFVGYVLAIPEVADLNEFLARYLPMLAGLGTAIHGFRPAESVIDLPAQGALSFLEHLARLAADKATSTETQDAIASVEYLHLDKIGNNIKTMASGRVGPRLHLLERYLNIVGRVGEKSRYSNPLFRRGLMLAMLDNRPWFEPFSELFATRPHRFFVPTDDPPRLPWFWADARTKFLEMIQDMPTEPHQPPPDVDDKLAELIYRIVRTYVTAKAKDKSGVNLDNFKDGAHIDWDKVPQQYKDDRRQIAESLFMEFRSRREQAFVDHFVARLGSVKQFISEDDYLAVSQALMTRGEDVKTMTLLALSANS